MNRAHFLLATSLVLVAPASAMVGGAPEIPDANNQPEVMLVGSGGNFCTGTVIARDLVLTAAHCINPGDHYKLVEMGDDRQPVFTDVALAARHPQFNLKTMLAHRATADVALLKLAAPLLRRPAPLLPARARVAPGEKFVVHGYGVNIRGEGNSAGRLREATLVATGQPGNLQLRLVDPKAGGTSAGLGACTGDSGSPAYQETPSGLAIYGVMSWSTGPNSEGGCGGLTGVTPLQLYRPWIEGQAARMGSVLPR
jgi:secreted trypsin-like serine protease